MITTALHPPAAAAAGAHPAHLPGGSAEPEPLSGLLAGILSRARTLQARADACGSGTVPAPASVLPSPSRPARPGLMPSAIPDSRCSTASAFTTAAAAATAPLPTPSSASASASGPSSASTQTPDHTARLTASGWPPRAVHTLPRMTGPALAKAREILPLMLGDGILILLGSTGRGKTVMATWWAWRRLLAGRSCGRLITAYQLFARMKQCWTRGEDADAALRGWRTAPFLAIDEVQSRAGSEWENAVLDELINARYASRLPTVLLGNLEPGGEQEALGPRILDRARECGGIIHCGWNSYRG